MYKGCYDSSVCTGVDENRFYECCTGDWCNAGKESKYSVVTVMKPYNHKEYQSEENCVSSGPWRYRSIQIGRSVILKLFI